MKKILALICGSLALTLTIKIALPHSLSSSRTSTSSSHLPKDTRIEYVTSWDWSDSTNHSFTTDLGYVVTIDAGYVGVMSIELLPCDETAAIRDLPIFSVDFASASANHGRMHDASLSEATFADSIFGAPRVFGEAPASGASYCKVHVLVAPIDETADDGFNLAHASVYLRGSYRARGEHDAHAFVTHTTIADGALARLAHADAASLANANHARVEITRHPTRAFDGIRFERTQPSSAGALAYAFVRKLDVTTTVEITSQ